MIGPVAVGLPVRNWCMVSKIVSGLGISNMAIGFSPRGILGRLEGCRRPAFDHPVDLQDVLCLPRDQNQESVWKPTARSHFYGTKV